MPVTVPVKLLFDTAELPMYATAGAGAVDLKACTAKSIRIAAGETEKIPTGLAVALPDGYGMFIASRSGLAITHDIVVLNAPGLIDSDYRGEICVVLKNAGSRVFYVHPGARIAQAFVLPLPQIEWSVVTDLPATARGQGAFGHTGT
jgi:dUTP pyrophosphatase